MRFKPCPFCGHMPTEDDVFFLEEDGSPCPYECSNMVGVSCGCGASMWIDVPIDLYDECMQKIEDAWNKRWGER